VIVTSAVRFPVVLGVNVTLISQLPFGGIDLPQLWLSAKSTLSVPVTAIDVISAWCPPVGRQPGWIGGEQAGQDGLLVPIGELEFAGGSQGAIDGRQQ
jgi:hypothetical protein